MNNQIAVLAVIVENPDSVPALNETLHEFSRFIIGRMGLPYRQRNLSLISLAVDAPEEVIADLEKRLASLEGITVQTAHAKH